MNDMLVFGKQPETLPIALERDATTALPLLRERNSILQLILAYLALPYSVTEYGCGKKATLIIDYLLDLGIPAFAIRRGLILERELSSEMLAQNDHTQRPHALLSPNPLSSLASMEDPVLQRMLLETCRDVRIEGELIHTGPFILRDDPQVQFVNARSHVFATLTFWDEAAGKTLELVIDPGLDREQLFEIEKVRELLKGPEALLFEAPLLGHFRLNEALLTPKQKAEIKALEGFPVATELEHWQSDPKAQAALIRAMTGAPKDSIGDPDCWTYANNMLGGDPPHDTTQKQNTGRGDGFFALTRALYKAREEHSGDAPKILAQLRQIAETSEAIRITKQDARWSAKQLAPLADVTMTVVYYNALCELGRCLKHGESPLTFLANYERLQQMRGLGVRLRRRIDWLADVSLEEDGRIDARALGPGFIRATIETIRQMNDAGLTVCIDRVGNCHGLLLDQREAADLRAGQTSARELLRHSIGHGSHIDTVNNAGRFDGRLGVCAGIEALHILTDLERYLGLGAPGKATPTPGEIVTRTHVTAFVGEEMTFTGEGVSMPGSAAVAGQAEVERIHRMTNGAGQVWRNQLIIMLRELRVLQAQAKLDIVNDLTAVADGDDEGLLAACSDPTEFYTRHSYERHIEQGPVLDRHNVPIVMVGTIMGIHQEDFFFEGPRAEAAALEMNRRLRLLGLQEQYRDVRITAGIIEGTGEVTSHSDDLAVATRWTFEGELNHAGATHTLDRRDPGVAAARVAHEFEKRASNLSDDGKLPTIVGNVRLDPGTNRNVIPGAVSVSFAIKKTPAASTQSLEAMLRDLHAYAIGTLSQPVGAGGEAMQNCRVDQLSYVTSYPGARLSIDLRSDKQQTTESFHADIFGFIREIESEYQVSIRSEVQQQLPPFSLEESGQALLMERSYGGSHNPNEAELLTDLVRGSVLQYAVIRDIFNLEGFGEDFNLFKFVEERLPQEWLRKLPRFTSGALHDTCNIAATAIAQRQALAR